MKRLVLCACLAACAPAWSPRAGLPVERLAAARRAWRPGVSPDGRAVAFLADAGEGAAAWSARVEDHPAEARDWRRLDGPGEAARAVAWSRDGRFVFVERAAGDGASALVRAYASGDGASVITPADGARHALGALSDDGRWLAWSRAAAGAADTELWVRDVDDEGAARRLTARPGRHRPTDFSPDGARLAVVETRAPGDQDVHVVDVATGAWRRVTARAPDAAARYEGAVFTPDGAALLLATDEGRDVVNVALLAVGDAPAPARYVIRDDHDVDAMALSPDGLTLAVAWNVDGASALRLYDTRRIDAPRELSRPGIPLGVVGAMEFSADGRTLAFDLSRPTAADAVYTLDARGRVSPVTALDHVATARAPAPDHGHEHGHGHDHGEAHDHGDTHGASLVEPSLVGIAVDAAQVSAWVYRPRDLRAGERAPAAVLVPGVGEQARPRWDPLAQHLASRGWVVVAPDPHGASGRGARWRREEGARVGDVAAVAAWAEARGDVAPGRVVVVVRGANDRADGDALRRRGLRVEALRDGGALRGISPQVDALRELTRRLDEASVRPTPTRANAVLRARR